MPRFAIRRHLWTAADDWVPVRDALGRWVVVDAAGRQPMMSPDPVTRMYAAHLVAMAPALRAGAAELARRYEGDGRTFGHDHRLVQFIHGSISASFPSVDDLRRAGAETAARQLTLTEAGDDEIVPVPQRMIGERTLRLTRLRRW